MSRIAQHCVNIMNRFFFSKAVLTCEEQDLKNQCLKTYCINLNQLCPIRGPHAAQFSFFAVVKASYIQPTLILIIVNLTFLMLVVLSATLSRLLPLQ